MGRCDPREGRCHPISYVPKATAPKACGACPAWEAMTSNGCPKRPPCGGSVDPLASGCRCRSATDGNVARVSRILVPPHCCDGCVLALPHRQLRIRHDDWQSTQCPCVFVLCWCKQLGVCQYRSIICRVVWLHIGSQFCCQCTAGLPSKGFPQLLWVHILVVLHPPKDLCSFGTGRCSDGCATGCPLAPHVPYA